MARILIVDDDQDLAEACQLVLKSEGHDVDWAASRNAGMKKIEESKPDLLILDVMMDQPDDGIQMAQDLQRKSRDFPILMLTSISKVTGVSYDKDNEMVPVDAFMEKPIKPEILIQKVKDLLNG